MALVATVLLQFAIQFVHAFENHQHKVCHAQNKVHIDKHEIDCAVFHYKINHNSIELSSSFLIAENHVIVGKIYSTENQISSVKLQFKSSRAPPSLLF